MLRDTEVRPLTSVFMTEKEATAEVERLRTIFSKDYYNVWLDRDVTDCACCSWFVSISRKP
jgi:hypothetical protein